MAVRDALSLCCRSPQAAITTAKTDDWGLNPDQLTNYEPPGESLGGSFFVNRTRPFRRSKRSACTTTKPAKFRPGTISQVKISTRLVGSTRQVPMSADARPPHNTRRVSYLAPWGPGWRFSESHTGRAHQTRGKLPLLLFRVAKRRRAFEHASFVDDAVSPFSAKNFWHAITIHVTCTLHQICLRQCKNSLLRMSIS